MKRPYCTATGSLKPRRSRNSFRSLAWMSIGRNRSTGSPPSRTRKKTAVSERKTTRTVCPSRERRYARISASVPDPRAGPAGGCYSGRGIHVARPRSVGVGGGRRLRDRAGRLRQLGGHLSLHYRVPVVTAWSTPESTRVGARHVSGDGVRSEPRRRRIRVLGIGGGGHDPRDIAGGGRPKLTAARRST